MVSMPRDDPEKQIKEKGEKAKVKAKRKRKPRGSRASVPPPRDARKR